MTNDEALDKAAKAAAMAAQLVGANIEKLTERAAHIVIMVLLDAGNAQQECCMASTLNPSQIADVMRTYIAKYDKENAPTKH